MKNIEELRKEIDLIDQKLVELFEARMKVVEDVATFKIMNNAPLKDSKREASLIKKNVALLKDPKYGKFLGAFFRDMMEYSRTYQKELMPDQLKPAPKEYCESKVVFQGLEGAFSSIALTEYFGKVRDRISVERFEDVFETLIQKSADFGILPIENSSTGAINEVYDLLRKYQMHIVGDYYLPIKHHLIGFPNTDIENLEAIYSHEQGFKQSINYLRDKNWKQYTYFNTAKSVAFVKELGNPKYAAIGSSSAAEAYGLKLLVSNIQDHDFNTTRFIIISHDQLELECMNKISIIVHLAHEPQALFKVLKIISDHHVNMFKIESRPVMDKPWEYLFYIDFEGSLDDERSQKMLNEIRSVVRKIDILGSYFSRNGV